MLDALKNLAGGGKAKKQHDELEALIATAREERSALSAMLTQVASRTGKLGDTGKALEQVEAKAAAARGALDGLTKTFEALERRGAGLAEVEKRVQALVETAAQAQKQADRVEEVSAQATAAQATSTR